MASQLSDDKKQAKEIGDIAGTAEATIKQSYKLMLPHAAKLLGDIKLTYDVSTLPSA